MTDNTIGKRIAALRKAQSMTQEELGAAVGVSGQAVSKWETGGMPDAELLPRIAGTLSCTIDALFGIEKQPEEYTDGELMELLFRHTLHRSMTAGQKRQEAYFPLLFELIWTVQCAYWVNEKRLSYAEAVEMYRNNPQISSQVINECGFSYISLTEGFPLLCAVMDDPGIGRTLAAEEELPTLFRLLGCDEGFRAVSFTLTHRTDSRYTAAALCERIGITTESFRLLEDALVRFGFLCREELVMDEKPVCTYHVWSHPQLVPLFMLASEFLRKRQCYYNFYAERQSPLLRLPE